MNARNRDLGSFVAEAMAKVAAAVPMPVRYEITGGREFENQRRTMAKPWLLCRWTLLLTFVVLFSLFGAIWDSPLITANVPVALLGDSSHSRWRE
jgi:cobalt-zinc-cadmium resistance protein CzcA